MTANKIVGWLVFFLGIAIILFGLYSSFNIFTGKAPAPEIFHFSFESLEEGAVAQDDLQGQMEQMVQGQIKEIIPLDFLPQLFNLISWSLLAGILIFGGAQIVSLGIKLMKKE